MHLPIARDFKTCLICMSRQVRWVDLERSTRRRSNSSRPRRRGRRHEGGVQQADHMLRSMVIDVWDFGRAHGHLRLCPYPPSRGRP